MSDSTSLAALLAPFGATVIGAALGGGFAYLGIRRSSGLTAVISREDRTSRESDAREIRINEKADAFVASLMTELAAMRAENLQMAQRLDQLWAQMRIAQDDIVVCQRQRAELAAGGMVLEQKVTDLTRSNTALQARVTQLEAGTA